jgi:hypothetical protein
MCGDHAASANDDGVKTQATKDDDKGTSKDNQEGVADNKNEVLLNVVNDSHGEG